MAKPAGWSQLPRNLEIGLTPAVKFRREFTGALSAVCGTLPAKRKRKDVVKIGINFVN